MATFGDVQGVSEGELFKNRVEVKKAGIHSQNQAGISGRAQEGADAIVLNEGYEDDEDNGDEIIYTGQGRRDLKSGSQIADQELERGNQALVTSELRGLPVRVIRGPKLKSPYAPKSGYRYDGLYRPVGGRSPGRDQRTDRIDRILLHPLAGLAIFVGVMMLLFQSIFSWAVPAMDGIDAAFGALGRLSRSALPAGLLRDLWTDGVLAGVGSVLIFLPQILIVFTLIHFLEDVGCGSGLHHRLGVIIMMLDVIFNSFDQFRNILKHTSA